MDRMSDTGEFTATATHREWDWLWSTLAFCPDPLSYPPQDMSGWCHWPYDGVAFGVPEQRVNHHGPAMWLPNTSGPEFSKGWLFQDNSVQNAIGSIPIWWEWTLAFGWDHTATQNGILRMVTINTGLFGWWFTASINAATKNILWRSLNGIGDMTGHIHADNLEGPNTVVISTKQSTCTTMYTNGAEAASTSSGQSIFKIQEIFLGCADLLKETDALGGTIGPFLLSRHAWSVEEVAQWSDDPWGFMRPDMHPIFPPVFVLPSPRWLCQVQGRDVPAEPAARDLPAAAEGRDTPAATEARDLPAEPAARDLPAAAEGRDLPAAAEGRTVPGPDDGSDRGTDVEDHASPRTTDVDSQSC